VRQRRRFRTFCRSRLKKDSIGALSAQAPTLPMDPFRAGVAQGADEGVRAELTRFNRSSHHRLFGETVAAR
jgi:hypothetical protein